MTLYKEIPDREELEALTGDESPEPLKVNGHFHTPYSFSAFRDLEQVFRMAREENVDVLGINDFYTMDGYEEFASLAREYRKVPLFNIEFMGLLEEEQENGIRVNDPNNPGRTYFSGKGLDYPVSLGGESAAKMKSVREESDKQTREMVAKTDRHLRSVDPRMKLDYRELRDSLTRGMVRERHIAKAVRLQVFQAAGSDSERREILEAIFGGAPPTSELEDTVALEGEIRSRLLKAGGVAYVQENPRAFLAINEVIRIILDAGGIPCYPVLLDNANGEITAYESDYDRLYKNLTDLNVYSVELIPGRNDHRILSDFVHYFDEKGFVITFGTEHNTPALDPLSITARGGTPLGSYLEEVSYRGACVIAAHQYLRSRNEKGFLDERGVPATNRDQLASLGHAFIQHFINQPA